MEELNNTFQTRDLILTATLFLVEPKLQLVRVGWDTNRQGTKVFFISPRKKAEELQKAYVAGNLKVDPSLLGTKIELLKHLSVDDQIERNYYAAKP